MMSNKEELIMSQSEHFLFGGETEIEDIGGGLKRQMLGYPDYNFC